MREKTRAPTTDKLENDENFPFIDLVDMARTQFLTFLKMAGFSSTKQSCVFGSHYLYMILKRFGDPELRVSIVSGGSDKTTGFRTNNGVIHKHMWVQCALDGQTWVADITADQFGFAPVCYVKLSDAQSAFLADELAITESLLENMHRDDEVLRKMFNVGLKD